MARKLKITKSSGNIFRDLGFPPCEAENLKLRSDLMIRLDMFCRQSGLTRAQAARRFGISQPRLNALLGGRIGQFNLDALVNIAIRAGFNVRLIIRGVERSRIARPVSRERTTELKSRASRA